MNLLGKFPRLRPPGQKGWPTAWIICTTILVFNINGVAWAQLSPGPLSRPHAHLEGLKKCTNCHKLGSRDIGEKCLECHEEIAAMRRGGPGVHAADDFSDCVDCHVEHQGENYDLIYWPAGRGGFDHRTTGFEMTGRHTELDCRKCHNAKYVVDAGALKAKKKDLGRTYLGLDPVCISCHENVHGDKGQVTATGACTECHDTKGWRPAPRFTHDRTAFPLTEKHQDVACEKCHFPADGTEGFSPVFANLPHAACSDCHQDPHVGALGSDCRRCHVTGGWLMIQGDAFDHSRTRYPLEGRHAAVTCKGCHSQDRKKPEFTACAACHADTHRASELNRPNLMMCETCHTVAGFRPSAYGLIQHEATTFPLMGAHRATPCNACHQPLGSGAANLAPVHSACADCHQDPHLGQADKFMTVRGCVSCHDQESWRSVAFDHGLTGFPLDARHQQVACLVCHPRAESGIGFIGLGRYCAGCHEDVHQGQFADKTTPDGQAVACDHCHVTVDWLAEKFDHERDSRFALKGGHERVACTVCHIRLESGNDRLLHFKPLPTTCKDCHAREPGSEGANR